MKNRGLIATIVVMSAIIVTLVIVLLVMQMSSIVPLRRTQDAESIENINESSTEATTEVETTIETLATPKLTAQIKTYTSHSDRIKINYPELVGLDDSTLLTKINQKLYDNAISIVKLYPISTALQRLDIACDVKYVNDDYITVVYEGRVVGDQASGANTNLKGTATINNSQVSKNDSPRTTDPYLDGFVDPLTLFPSNTAPQTIVTPVQPVEIRDNSNAVDQAPSNNKANTSDSGPTVSPSITPTAERTSGSISDNTARTNHSNQQTYTGIYNGAPNTYYGDVNSSSAPVYGQTGTSISASTINQKIYYTNTIDLRTGQNVTLKDYNVDFEKLAKFARSSEVEFANIDETNRSQVRSYINKTVVTKLTEQLEKNSDFKNESITVWPKHFSYRDEDGTIYVSIKLSSRLGNYAIIKYNK